jgi:hypothetical protein
VVTVGATAAPIVVAAGGSVIWLGAGGEADQQSFTAAALELLVVLQD